MMDDHREEQQALVCKVLDAEQRRRMDKEHMEEEYRRASLGRNDIIFLRLVLSKSST